MHAVRPLTPCTWLSRKRSIFAITLLAAVVAPMLSNPMPSHAVTDCSPNAIVTGGSGASWLNGGGVNVCTTGDDSNNYVDNINGVSTLSGFKWECVELVNRLYLTNGWITANWLGNGNTLINHVPAGLTPQNNDTISYVNVGDVITLDNGGNGHAAIINTVSGNTVNIISQNGPLNSSASITSGSLSTGNAHYNSSWFGYTVQSIIHHPVTTPPPTNPLRIGALFTSGAYHVKEADLGAGWHVQTTFGATQGMQDETLTGMIFNGMFLVKQGNLDGVWTTELSSGAVQGSISDTDGTTPIRIGVVKTDGTFWVKEGLNGSWVLEQGAVVAGYVSGNRIAALLSDGTFEVKEGSLSAGWVVENGSVRQGIIAGGSGGLIGIVFTSGTLQVKQGGLGAGWITENGAVANAQLSNGSSQTPDRIGDIDTGGNYWVKEGIGGGWVLEQGAVSQAALSGNLIGAVLTDGTYEVKQGGLGAGWVTEQGTVAAPALWSQY